MEKPRRLRDLLWTPARLRGGPALKDTELGEILLPALTPFAWQDADDAIRLGRMTAWVENESGAGRAGRSKNVARGRRGVPASRNPKTGNQSPSTHIIGQHAPSR